MHETTETVFRLRSPCVLSGAQQFEENGVVWSIPPAICTAAGLLHEVERRTVCCSRARTVLVRAHMARRDGLVVVWAGLVNRHLPFVGHPR
jgi:hypothetical protein